MGKRIVLAGGGTAGHVNPLLATAQVLVDRGHQVTVLGTSEGLESRLVPQAGLQLLTLPKVPLPRRPSKDLFTVPRRLSAAVTQASEHLEGADVLLGFGGYVSAPAYIAARRAGIPFVVQEQNVRPGWANRLGARDAAAVSLAFPQTKLKARHGKTVFTGLPLRRAIVDLAAQRGSEEGAQEARESGCAAFGLDPKKPVLLVTGGSLGAQHLNEVIAQAAPAIAETAQILHGTGAGKDQAIVEVAAKYPNLTWVVREYIGNMEEALAAADLVLCRSGAGTVAELGALGLPAFYVPLPIGNGEQRRNAEEQVAVGGALIVPDGRFDEDVVRKQVLPLLRDAAALKVMGEANRSTSPGDGAALVADLVEAASEEKR